MENKIKTTIHLDKREPGIVQPNGGYASSNINDYYINVKLNRKIKIFDDYVDIQKDPFRTEMDRQNINPWFIEFGFFESITYAGITGKTNDYKVVLESQDIVKKAKIFSIDINR